MLTHALIETNLRNSALSCWNNLKASQQEGIVLMYNIISAIVCDQIHNANYLLVINMASNKEYFKIIVCKRKHKGMWEHLKGKLLKKMMVLWT